MVLGEKLWEGKGKSDGPGFIKYAGREGVASMYSWSAQRARLIGGGLMLRLRSDMPHHLK